ncbi:hypothetical protein [Roseicella aquatilis]|nr:hypothetical protein [Roseicella aquatilis]
MMPRTAHRLRRALAGLRILLGAVLLAGSFVGFCWLASLVAAG